jgi:hypothetical protein
VYANTTLLDNPQCAGYRLPSRQLEHATNRRFDCAVRLICQSKHDDPGELIRWIGENALETGGAGLTRLRAL